MKKIVMLVVLMSLMTSQIRAGAAAVAAASAASSAANAERQRIKKHRKMDSVLSNQGQWVVIAWDTIEEYYPRALIIYNVETKETKVIDWGEDKRGLFGDSSKDERLHFSVRP